jgi:hypothetical protein
MRILPDRVFGRDKSMMVRLTKMASALKNVVSHIVIRSGRKTYKFDVAGSTDAISKVIEQCPNPILK